ncbi:MAG TPA: hypothetical protein VKA10_03380, partial [Prolixibacteraceae bacterium]|nr:hypothetical protein [Prolixibacteraceae bacterium]
RGKVKKWTTENKKTYRVEIDQLDKPIVFFEDEERKQWWYEIESVRGEKRIMACTNEEYFRASENEIPGQWLKYVQKMDRFSK